MREKNPCPKSTRPDTPWNTSEIKTRRLLHRGQKNPPGILYWDTEGQGALPMSEETALKVDMMILKRRSLLSKWRICRLVSHDSSHHVTFWPCKNNHTRAGNFWLHQLSHTPGTRLFSVLKPSDTFEVPPSRTRKRSGICKLIPGYLYLFNHNSF